MLPVQEGRGGAGGRASGGQSLVPCTPAGPGWPQVSKAQEG